MYYIYRFIDKNKNIIYVGKSKQVLEQRFRGHTHLPDECYASVHKIEYITCSKHRFSKAIKVEIINKYLSGESSQKALAKEYDVSVTSINRWVNDYQKYGDRFLD